MLTPFSLLYCLELPTTTFLPHSGAEAEMRVSGTHHMREVLGSEAVSLLDGKKETKMLDHVIHKCLSLTPGLWDEDAEKFDTSDPVAFSVLLLRQRTYGRDKITPVALTGDEDEEFQQQFVMSFARRALSR